jgi:phage tail sheath gpL-like
MSAASYTNIDGETVSTTTADGQNIFDTDHTITGGSTNYSNLVTTAFSRAGLEAAELKFVTFADNSGNKVVVNPDTIVTTDDPTLVNAVKEFTRSTLVPDNAHNATNVYAGKYNHIVLPYLSTTAAGVYNSAIKNYWMLADVAHSDAICEISENPTFKAPSVGGNGEDFETDDWKFKSSATYDYGVLDFKWIVGSTGAA